MQDFEKYIINSEPNKKERAEAWNIAIGLQQVDGLTTSEYLHKVAEKHIEGDIDIDEAKKLIHSYYESKQKRDGDVDNQEEADKVSANITKLLNEESFTFSPITITSIHKKIFDGVFPHAGKVRHYDITKREWVLNGDTVLYTNHEDIHAALAYDIQQEKDFSYAGLSNDDMIAHIGKFVAGLWQIHPFEEGNTRTTAVFLIKYLRANGFNINNKPFENNSWYFRNALVRANYRNREKNINPDINYLNLFLRNLLLGENNELRNRYVHIDALLDNEDTQIGQVTGQVTGQVQNIYPTHENINEIVAVLGLNVRTVKQIMEGLALKGRDHFLKSYLNPSIKEGYITPIYKDKPQHPRQKYELTLKGLLLYNMLSEKEQTTQYTDIDLYLGVNGTMNIRCKVAGVQQMAKEILDEDKAKYEAALKSTNKKELDRVKQQLAQKYFKE